jgi:hypothetical protein
MQCVSGGTQCKVCVRFINRFLWSPIDQLATMECTRDIVATARTEGAAVNPHGQKAVRNNHANNIYFGC